jgi:hypothetical protein
VVLAQRCGQTSVVARVASLLGQREGTVRQRLCARGVTPPRKRLAVEVETCCAPLRGWILAWWAPGPQGARRLALAVDATPLGTRCTVLALGVVSRRWCAPGGRGGHAGEHARRVAAPRGAPAPACGERGADGVDGGRARRSGPLRAVALPGQCGTGLAARPAAHWRHGQRAVAPPGWGAGAPCPVC